MTTSPYYALLKSYAVNKSDNVAITHTMIGDKSIGVFGGSYHIPIEKNDEFLTYYYNEIMKNNKNEYLIERQTGDCISMDFDFHFDPSMKTRLISKDECTLLAHTVCDILAEMYQIDSSFDLFVLQKPNVNCLDTKTKDGIHIIVGMKSDFVAQTHIRNKLLLLAESGELFSGLPVINKWGDVIDECIFSGANGLSMIGSRKPSNEAYELTYAWNCSIDSRDNETLLDERDISEYQTVSGFKSLSLRYPDHPSFFMRSSFVDIHSAMITIKQRPEVTYPVFVSSNAEKAAQIEVIEYCLSKGFLRRNANANGNEWSKVGMYFKAAFGENGRRLFNEFNLMGKHGDASKNKYDEHGNNDRYDGFPSDSDYGKFVSFVKWCRVDSPDMWTEVEQKFDILACKLPVVERGVVAPGLIEAATATVMVGSIPTKKHITLEILDKGENDVAKFIFERLNSTLVYCKKLFYKFDTKTCLWRVIDNPTACIITFIQNCIDEAKIPLLMKKMATESDDEKAKLNAIEKKYNEFYKQVGKGAFTNQIVKILQDYLHNGDFDRTLDATPYIAAYTDGILDLKTGLFRAGLLADDKLTQTIPFKYMEASDADIAKVKQEIKKICNYNDAHTDYYLSGLGYSMTGDASIEQILVNIRGQKASNGKSVIFDALTEIIPNYIVELENNLFDKDYGEIHKSVAGWRGKRIGYLNELSKRKLNADLLKKVADGTSIPYKVMYGTTATMPICFKLFIVGNHTMKVDADCGIQRRLRMMQLDSDFIDDLVEDDPANCRFKKDTNFGKLLQTKYKHALLALIFQYSKQYVADGNKLKPYPGEWVEACDETISTNNKFEEYFYNYFEVDADGTVSKRVMDEIIENFKKEQINIRDKLKSMKIPFTYDSRKKLSGETTKGCYYGIKKLELTSSVH